MEAIAFADKNLDNKELRSEVAEGAYYAGRAIDITTTTAPHAFSYNSQVCMEYRTVMRWH